MLAALSALLTISLLAACATPQPPAPKAVYDFGPITRASATAQTATAPRRAAISLPEIEAGASLQSPALLYRLQYANAQELRPYAGARWSAEPAQLVRERIRNALAVHGPVLSTEGVSPYTLRIELDEFSQLFEAPEKSQGLLRLRASLFKGNALAAQTTFQTQANAPSADASGGVKALAGATDEAAKQIAAWLAGQLK